ncbi:hypothetical protein NDU88_003855 [Pleurodeles waltl]|uniref:Uncharacterized protein n=1 Tax=Pleurodeles waltl TaxID=8319 RepID=A0AAV7QA73_PLEWA|nr:hypothetical protein NDU88_003855 [Pleurodeles waltl]
MNETRTTRPGGMNTDRQLKFLESQRRDRPKRGGKERKKPETLNNQQLGNQKPGSPGPNRDDQNHPSVFLQQPCQELGNETNQRKSMWIASTKTLNLSIEGEVWYTKPLALSEKHLLSER